MNFKKCFLSCLGLFMLVSSITAQKTAIYRDAHAHYKRGMEFFEQSLFGKAQEEFGEVLNDMANITDVPAPLFVMESELYYGISALRLDHPDSEKELSHFVQHYQPHPLTAKAQLELGRYYYNKKEYGLAAEYFRQAPTAGLPNKDVVEIKFKLGYCYFHEDQMNKAKPYFQQVKGIGGTDYYAPANYYYGIIAFLDQDYDNALESFKTVSKVNRYNHIVPSYICQIYFAQGNYDELITYGSTAIEDTKTRERPQIEQLIGQAYFEKGQYAEALPYLESYVDSKGKVSAETLYQLAYTQYKTGNYAKAIRNFESLNTQEDEMGQYAMYALADCHLKSNNKDAARIGFQQASMLNHDATIRESSLMNYAKLCYELGLDTDAITALQKIPMSSNYYNEAQNLLSEIFLNTRDYDHALEILRAMPDRSTRPNMNETYQKVAYFRAVQLYNDARYEDALKLFDESVDVGVHPQTTALGRFWKAEALYNLERYDESITEYNKYLNLEKTVNRLPANSSRGVGLYGLGYNYLRKGEYGVAAGKFKDAVDYIAKNWAKMNDAHVTQRVYPDAILRAGDCYLQENNYRQAAKYYKKIIDDDYPEQDYALYQQSLIYSLQRKPYEQIALLDRLVRDYPSSDYADDAVYAKGLTQMNLKQYDVAETSFRSLLTTYPDSDFKGRTLIKLGVIAYSKGRNEEAKNYYKTAVQNNPQSEEAQDAFDALQEICENEGTPEEAIIFWETVTGQKIDDIQRDTLLYRSADKQYRSGDWEQAVTGFSKYLTQFPSGINSLKARFYRAESYFNLENYDLALNDYNYLSENNNPAFAERSHYQAALIAYHIKRDYEGAYRFFGRLEPVASDDDIRYEALQFKMRSGFYAGIYDDLPSIVERFLAESRPSQAERAEAYYYLGKAEMSLNDYAKAKGAFTENINLSSEDAMSAESRYQIAYMTYKQRDLDGALDLCFETAKEIPNQTYWLVKVYILLGDIYAEKGELLQAKATLQSIVDNYNGDQALLDEARTKLEAVKKAEENNSRLDNSGGNGKVDIIEED